MRRSLPYLPVISDLSTAYSEVCRLSPPSFPSSPIYPAPSATSDSHPPARTVSDTTYSYAQRRHTRAATFGFRRESRLPVLWGDDMRTLFAGLYIFMFAFVSVRVRVCVFTSIISTATLVATVTANSSLPSSSPVAQFSVCNFSHASR